MKKNNETNLCHVILIRTQVAQIST